MHWEDWEVRHEIGPPMRRRFGCLEVWMMKLLCVLEVRELNSTDSPWTICFTCFPPFSNTLLLLSSLIQSDWPDSFFRVAWVCRIWRETHINRFKLVCIFSSTPSRYKYKSKFYISIIHLSYRFAYQENNKYNL